MQSTYEGGARIAIQRARRYIGLRWLLLLIFPIGYVSTASVFSGHEDKVIFLSATTLVALFLVLSRLDRPMLEALPIWVILAVSIIGYHIKFYWLALNPRLSGDIRWLITDLASVPGILVDAFGVTTLGFAAFAFTSWLWLGIRRGVDHKLTHSKAGQLALLTAYRTVSAFLVRVLPLLVTILTWVMYALGIAVMGVASRRLPFRLAGVIFYTRQAILPALMLLLLWTSDQANRRGSFAFGILLMLGFGIADSFVRSSRGGLLSVALPAAFLFLVTGQFRGRRFRLIVCAVVATMLMWPLVSELRQVRVGASSGVVEAVAYAWDQLSAEGTPVSAHFCQGAASTIRRVIGIDNLLPIVGLDMQPLGLDGFSFFFQQRGGLTSFYTHDVMGYSTYTIHGSAPSLIGWFYLMGGTLSVFLGMVGYTLAAMLIWQWLSRAHLYTRPVAQAVFLSWLLSLTSEGTLDGALYPILANVVGVILCEFLVRSALPRARIRAENLGNVPKKPVLR